MRKQGVWRRRLLRKVYKTWGLLVSFRKNWSSTSAAIFFLSSWKLYSLKELIRCNYVEILFSISLMINKFVTFFLSAKWSVYYTRLQTCHFNDIFRLWKKNYTAEGWHIRSWSQNSGSVKSGPHDLPEADLISECF